MLLIELACLGKRLIQRNRPIGAAQQRQHDGSLVAEVLVALRRQFFQGLDIARTDFHHRQAHSDQPLLVALPVGLGGALIPVPRRVLFPARVQQAGLQQQCFAGGGALKRLVRRDHRLLDCAVAPLQVGNRQVTGGLTFGTQRHSACVGPQTRYRAVDTVATQNRLAIHRGELVGIEALCGLQGSDEFGKSGGGVGRWGSNEEGANDREREALGKHASCRGHYCIHPQLGQRR